MAAVASLAISAILRILLCVLLQIHAGQRRLTGRGTGVPSAPAAGGAGMPEHTRRCAADLVGRMLAVDPAARPSMAAVAAHALWWEPAATVLKAKAVYDSRRALPEAALAACGLAGADIRWQERVDPALLARILGFSGACGLRHPTDARASDQKAPRVAVCLSAPPCKRQPIRRPCMCGLACVR